MMKFTCVIFISFKRKIMSSMRNYQRCTNCIMDTTDSKIFFYSEKVCDFCKDYKKNSSQLENWRRRQQKLNGITKSVRVNVKI